MSCNYLDQSCHGGTPEQWKRCAARHGVECDMLDFGWTHYPNSPFGDVDICTHGVCRTHGTNDDECKWCTPHRILICGDRNWTDVHPDEKVLWFREGQFDAAKILSGEVCTVSLLDSPGSIKPLYEWSLSPDFPKLAGFMIGDESRFRRILGVSKDGDNVIYEVGRCARFDGQPTIRKVVSG